MQGEQQKQAFSIIITELELVDSITTKVRGLVNQQLIEDYKPLFNVFMKREKSTYKDALTFKEARDICVQCSSISNFMRLNNVHPSKLKDRGIVDYIPTYYQVYNWSPYKLWTQLVLPDWIKNGHLIPHLINKPLHCNGLLHSIIDLT